MAGVIDFAFLDSGTGGLPYMLALKQKSPSSRCVYLGDTAHFPYGEKTSEQIASCAASVIDRMIASWHPRVLVVACNTMSVTALDDLRALFPQLPIVGTVPAIKLAAKVSQNKRIGLLSTSATAHHPYCQRLIADFAQDCTIFTRADPALITFIEKRLFLADADECFDAALPAARYFASCGCDTLILGCTHFTHMARDIERAFRFATGGDVFVVDSREGVSNRALDVLDHLSPAPTAPAEPLPPDMTFFVTRLKEGAECAEYESLCNSFAIPFGGVF